MEYHFRITGGPEDGPFLFQFSFQLRHVVYFTVVDNGISPGSICVYHGLMACDKINDLQSYMGQAAASVQISTLVIWSPAFLYPVHFI